MALCWSGVDDRRPRSCRCLHGADEFFAYLGHRLHERFITDPAELPGRLAAIDNAHDPDGRFQVSELFCANITWQPAVLSLIDRASVVLLDLRKYARHRAGTRFELEELLRRAPLHKVLVIVDANHPLDDIRHEIESIWQSIAGGAPPTAGAPLLQLVRLARGSDVEMLGLFPAAAAAAARTSAIDQDATSKR